MQKADQTPINVKISNSPDNSKAGNNLDSYFTKKWHQFL